MNHHSVLEPSTVQTAMVLCTVTSTCSYLDVMNEESSYEFTSPNFFGIYVNCMTTSSVNMPRPIQYQSERASVRATTLLVTCVMLLKRCSNHPICLASAHSALPVIYRRFWHFGLNDSNITESCLIRISRFYVVLKVRDAARQAFIRAQASSSLNHTCQILP